MPTKGEQTFMDIVYGIACIAVVIALIAFVVAVINEVVL